MAASMDELVESTIQAMAGGGDLAPLLTEDVLVMGTDPDEYWEGRETAVAAQAKQDEVLGRPTFTAEGDRRVRVHGETAWYAEHMQVQFGEGSLRMRLTGVAVLEDDGQWRFAQVQAAPAQEPVPL
jgi:ketosteroid isomerase-like protein